MNLYLPSVGPQSSHAGLEFPYSTTNNCNKTSSDGPSHFGEIGRYHSELQVHAAFHCKVVSPNVRSPHMQPLCYTGWYLITDSLGKLKVCDASDLVSPSIPSPLTISEIP